MHLSIFNECGPKEMFGQGSILIEVMAWVVQ